DIAQFRLLLCSQRIHPGAHLVKIKRGINSSDFSFVLNLGVDQCQWNRMSERCHHFQRMVTVDNTHRAIWQHTYEHRGSWNKYPTLSLRQKSVYIVDPDRALTCKIAGVA